MKMTKYPKIRALSLSTIISGALAALPATAQPPASESQKAPVSADPSRCSDYLPYPFLGGRICSPPVSQLVTPACQYLQGMKEVLQDPAAFPSAVGEYAVRQAPLEVYGSDCKQVLVRLYNRLTASCSEASNGLQQKFVDVLEQAGCFGIPAEGKDAYAGIYALGYFPGSGLRAETVDPRTERLNGCPRQKLELTEYRKQMAELFTANVISPARLVYGSRMVATQNKGRDSPQLIGRLYDGQ